MTRDALLFRLYTGLILLIALAAIFAPLLTSYDPYESQIQMSLLPPSAEHYFGTDKLGRDLFTRVLYGARVSLTMTLFVVILIAGLGTLIGVISAYVGGKVDTVIMRLSSISGHCACDCNCRRTRRKCGQRSPRHCSRRLDEVCAPRAQPDAKSEATGLFGCRHYKWYTTGRYDSSAYPAEYHADHYCDRSA